MLWTSLPPVPPLPHHHLVDTASKQTLITTSASTATVSVVPTPFVGCTSPLAALDPASLAKLQQNALSSAPHTPQMPRMSFSHDISSAHAYDLGACSSGDTAPSSPTSSEKEHQQLMQQFQSSQNQQMMMIHPPHKHSTTNSPNSPHTAIKSKKNMLNSWRTSLRSKGRSSSGRFPASAIPPIPTVISEGATCDVMDSPRSPGYTTDEDVQNSKNDNSQNFEWNLNMGRRWSEIPTNPKMVQNFL